MYNRNLLGLPQPISKLVETRLKEYNHAMFEAYALSRREIFKHVEEELYAQRILMYNTIFIFSIVIGCLFSCILWCRKKRKKRTR